MKKVAIMTWYSYKNYGSKLQATAMKEILTKRELHPVFINYIPRGAIKRSYKISQIEILKKILKKIKTKINNKDIVITNVKFDEYSENFLKETELCDSYVDLYQLNNQYDAFFCGSDQIWSPNNFDPRYFLDFADTSKIIAYAPSIGLDSIDSIKIRKQMKELINRFTYLSIREETGAKLIEELCHKKANVVIDPTLLLDSKEWEKYENLEFDKELKTENYIITYFLGESKKHLKEIEHYAKKNNLKIYNIPVYQKRRINQYNYPKDIGPSEFLSLIKNSHCVFTDSFHGMIFSINYNVNFYAYKRFQEKSKINQNSRVIDILRRIKLEDRLIDKNTILSENRINYEIVNKRLFQLRKEANNFLDNALKNVLNSKEKPKEISLTDYCSGCSACASVCPVKAITMKENDEGFLSPIIDNKKCIKCGLCQKTCPMLKLETTHINKNQGFYSFKSLDKNILETSSSGGFAHILASILNEEGYYVCGCSYNNEKDIAEHIIIEPNQKKELEKLQGSKYIQSHCEEAIEKCIEIAKNNKVLFIGTPCQVAGINKLAKLKKRRDNFILIDLICHGVPSNHLWKKYLKEIFSKHPKLKEQHKIIMRNGKLTKERKYILSMQDEKGKIIYKNDQSKDLFYSFFNDGTCYNKSCFECPYRTKSSADIRTGDYWGNKFKNDNTGISMVTVMTEKGNTIIQKIDSKMAEVKKQDSNDYYSAQFPVNRNIPQYRDELIADIKNKNISLTKTKNKFFKYQNIKQKLYKIIKIIKR